MLSTSFFHVAMVVPSLEDALDHLGASLGLVWAPTVETEVPAGDRLVPLRFAYSAEAPHLEVIEEAPGSVWVRNPYSNLHHIGFWADGLEGERDRLVGAGCPLEVAGFGGEPDRTALYTYHTDPLGLRVELINAALRPVMEEGFASARGRP